MTEDGQRIKTDTDFAVRQSEMHGVPVILVRGEIDVATAPELREALHEIVQSGATMSVADLTDVSFVDSTALGVLVTAVKQFRSNGGDLRLVITQPHISKVLDITGLSEVFAVYPTAEAALKP